MGDVVAQTRLELAQIQIEADQFAGDIETALGHHVMLAHVAAAAPLPAIQNSRIRLITRPSPLRYSSTSAVQVLPLRRYCVAISPEALSCWSAQAPRTYDTRLRSRPVRSASRAAALKSTRLGGVNRADMASSSVDLPEPERPTNKKPFAAIGTSVKPLNVPQLWTCRRRMRNCCTRGSGRSSANRLEEEDFIASV